MTAPRHAGEAVVGAADVRRLLRAQVPGLADLPLRPFGTGGTDNALWRIGDGALGRFPRLARAEAGLLREVRWLPALPDLPLSVPRLRFAGQGDARYPLAWAILDLLPGVDALAAPPEKAAGTLAALIAALWAAPMPPDLPPAGPGRLAPGSLAFARKMAAAFTREEGDTARLVELLDAAGALPDFAGPPVWTHGDLHPLNLLVAQGRLSAVIDWGSLGAGDPARDLICGWTMLDAAGRAELRATLVPDPAAWDRARAFALVMAVQAIPYYRDTDARFRAVMQRTLAEVLADL